MKRALRLARRGYGKVSPNPMVGAVLVKDQRIIGEGYHTGAGHPHAECEALTNCREDPRGADLYVNLEPCSHFGRTPPCTQAIIQAGIRRVIIGGPDPNPLVNGKGIAQLRQAGIEVTEGILEESAARLNEIFFYHIRTRRPFCALKLALTLDGKTADRWGGSKWITHPLARRHVHHLRAGYDAVLTGAQTVRADNPELTVRLVRGRNPYRVVVSSQNHLDPQTKLVQNNRDRKTILLTTADQPAPDSSYEVIRISTSSRHITPEQILETLAERGFTSVMIEAGHTLSSQFLAGNLLQRIYLFYGPKILGPGQTPFESISPRPIDKAIGIVPLSFRHFGDTMMIEGEPG